MEGLRPQWGGADWGLYPEVEAGDGLLRRVMVQLLWVREGRPCGGHLWSPVSGCLDARFGFDQVWFAIPAPMYQPWRFFCYFPWKSKTFKLFMYKVWLCMVKNDCVYSKHAVNSFSFVIAYVLMQPNASVSYLQLSQHHYPFLRTTCEHTPAHAPPWAACRHCPFLFLHAEKKPNSLLSSPCYRGSFLAWYGRAVLQHPCDTELSFPPSLHQAPARVLLCLLWAGPGFPEAGVNHSAH